ncbi:hypothetical protein ACW4YW_03700 [Methylobacillus pratensis]
MKFIQFLRSPSFAIFAISTWVISFLLISSSQAHNNFGYVLLFIPTLLTLDFREIKELFNHPVIQGLLAVIFTLTLAAYIGDGSPWKQIKFGLIVLLFYLSVARLPFISNQTAYKAAWGFLSLLILYIVFNAAWQYHQGQWLLGMRMSELNAKLENAIYVTNTMGGMLAIITLIGMQTKRYGPVVLANFLVLFFSLIILQTRSIIGIWLLISLLTSLSLFREQLLNRKLLIYIMGASIIIGLAIIGLFIFSSIGDNLLGRKFYRFEIWSGFIAETLQCDLWLGCGPEHKFIFTTQDDMPIVHAHSAFITQFYKAGIIGFIPLIALTIWTAVKGIQTRAWAAWYFMAGALGLCFDGSSLIHSPSQRWLVFHLPLALFVAQQLNQKKLALNNQFAK